MFRNIYTYCELEPVKEGQAQSNPVYETKSWAPPTLLLQEISARLKTQVDVPLNQYKINTNQNININENPFFFLRAKTILA